jgi:purine-binding chemotaxis protein CheW
MTSEGRSRGRRSVTERLRGRVEAAHAFRAAAFTESVLKLRAKRLAAPRTLVDVSPAGLAVLCFRVGAERFGVPLDALTEVMPLNAWTPVPGQTQHLLGVTNLRGEIRPVLDLHVMLSLPAPEDGLRAHVVFLKRDDGEVGLRVDALDRIRFVDSATLTVPHEAGNGLPQRFVAGITPDTLALLDVRQILALDVLQDRRAGYRHAS